MTSTNLEPVRRPRPRLVVALLLVGPRIRSGLLLPVSGAALLAVLATIGARLGSVADHTAGLVLQVVILVLAAAAGFVLDDPSEPTVAAVPTTLLARRLTGLAPVAAVITAAWWASVLLVGGGAEAVTSTAALISLAAVSVAVAAVVAPAFGGRAGFVASSAVLLVALLVTRLPESWSMLPDPESGLDGHAQLRWLALALAALVVFVLASRDPGRPRRNRPSR